MFVCQHCNNEKERCPQNNCDNENEGRCPRYPDGTCVCHTGVSENIHCSSHFSCVNKKCIRYKDPNLPLPKPDI